MTELLQSLRDQFRRREFTALLRRVDPAADYGHERGDILLLAANAALQSSAWETGVALLEELCRLHPEEPRLRRNLSQCCNELGRECAARDAALAGAWYQRALVAWADNPAALFNLGQWQRARGQLPAALATFDRLLALSPDDIEAAANAAELRFEQGNFDDAEAMALGADPESCADPTLLERLAALLERLGHAGGARRVYRRLLALQPGWPVACKALLSIAPVPGDGAELRAERAHFECGLEELAAAGFRGLAETDARWANFMLAYQGLEDSGLLARYGDILASVLAPADPSLPARMGPAGRPVICMVSSGFRDCTVGAYFGSWVQGLEAAGFEVVLLQLGPHADAMTQRLLAQASGGEVVPGVPELLDAMFTRRPDMVLYPELGMDHRLLPVAARRLAPVQVAAWGHPETTGLATIDYVVTCAAMEPEACTAHYRERLILLPGIGTCYQPAALPPAGEVQRDRLGLPPTVPLLLQPQSSFKIHPDNDALMARCLARVPQCRLVLFQDSERGWQHRLNRRLAREFAAHGVDFETRVILLPRLQRADYLAVNACCTVMLDSRHFSGGNTSLDAITAGLPIVTWPGALMRGRQSMAMLQLLGLAELVVDDAAAYVAAVEKVCLQPGYRSELGRRIIAGHPRLFGDPEPVASLARQLWDILRGQSGA